MDKVLILVRTGAKSTSHAFDHNTVELRTDYRGAFFTWVDCFDTLAIQEEELVIAMPI